MIGNKYQPHHTTDSIVAILWFTWSSAEGLFVLMFVLYLHCPVIQMLITSPLPCYQTVSFQTVNFMSTMKPSMLSSSISDSEVEIPGFYVFRNDRNRNGGGVVLYVKDFLSPHVICKDFHSVHFTIGSIYRPPNAPISYFDLIISDLEIISSLSTSVIIMGELNFNCFDKHSEKYSANVIYFFSGKHVSTKSK